MLVLDTDHMSLLESAGERAAILRNRLATIDPKTVATTIITYEEQMRGWMAYVARANTLSNLNYSRVFCCDPEFGTISRSSLARRSRRIQIRL